MPGGATLFAPGGLPEAERATTQASIRPCSLRYWRNPCFLHEASDAFNFAFNNIKKICGNTFHFNHIHSLALETSVIASITFPFSTEVHLCLCHSKKVTSERNTNLSLKVSKHSAFHSLTDEPGCSQKAHSDSLSLTFCREHLRMQSHL